METGLLFPPIPTILNPTAGRHLSFNRAGNAFPKETDLFNATEFYHDSAVTEPNEDDYATVLKVKAFGGETAQYIFCCGEWALLFVLKDNKSAGKGRERSDK